MARSQDGQQRRVTIADVARRAGVSPMTVSRAINAPDSVQAATRANVQQAMDELAYVPNSAARSLVVRRLGVIALVVPDLSNPFFVELARTVEELARARHLTVLLGNTVEDLSVESDYIRAITSLGVDGVLLVPVGDGSATNIRLLDRLGTQVVLVDRHVRGIEVDQVVGDSFHAASALAAHLIGHGHKRIGVISGPRSTTTGQNRVRGWQDAMRNHGLPAPRELAKHTTFSRDAGYKAALDLLTQDKPPTALIAANHFLAFGAMDAAKQLGRRVPEDLALVTFDDVEVTVGDPILTCADQPVAEMGQAAFDLLQARIQDPSRPISKIRIASDLRIRRTCGC